MIHLALTILAGAFLLVVGLVVLGGLLQLLFAIFSGLCHGFAAVVSWPLRKLGLMK